MLIAPYPANEEARLRFLRSMDILDSPPEECFDRITRVAAELLQVPIALVSLVDANRQWFKARVGLEISETPRDIAFCAHALHAETALVIPDTLADVRFHDNPVVTGPPFIRFYAGIPLRSSEGLVLGTLCAIDSKPRTFPERTLSALADLARIVERELLQRVMMDGAKTVHDDERRSRALSDARFATVFENTPTGKAIVDLQGKFAVVNRKFCHITGYTAQELLSKTFPEITHPDDTQNDLVQVSDLLFGKRESYELEKRYVRKDGSHVWVDLNVAIVRDDAGGPLHFIAEVLDISERKRSEALMNNYHLELEHRVTERTLELIRSQETLQALADNLPLLIAQVDAQLRYVFNNARYRDIFGVDPASLRGQSLASFLDPRLYQELLPSFEKALAGERVIRDDICYDPSDERIWCATYIPDIRNDQVIGFFIMSQDVTERKRNEKVLIDKAMLDSLTGLPNRAAMGEKLNQAIALAAHGGPGFSLFFLDLDGFKHVNDAHGHEAGDELLRKVSARLTTVVRQDDFVCRLAGDEFVLIATGATNPAICERIGSTLCSALAEPFVLAKTSVCIGTSVGITICQPEAVVTSESVMAAADAAMYQAKRKGRNCFQFSTLTPGSPELHSPA